MRTSLRGRRLYECSCGARSRSAHSAARENTLHRFFGSKSAQSLDSSAGATQYPRRRELRAEREREARAVVMDRSKAVTKGERAMQFPRGIGPSLVVVGLAGAMAPWVVLGP